ncbi:MAG TPA: alpha-amylase family glycosyl hydrolase [Gemmatales bacterium]|nr:alpha-amylase family glycosyl hydrolase [Gemmatales bacterium]
MNMTPRYPSLYQINTRVWLTELSRTLGRRATLDDIPDSELDQLAQKGFDWVWLLSVWQTGQAAQQVSRTNPEWRKEFQATLPDLKEDDIAGSGFAITGYTVHSNLGGDAALARLRKRLQQRGLRLLLDFVPNHMALDHPWVFEHPEYFVHGTELDLARSPRNYTRIHSKQGSLLLAHGRDPYFPGWPDTVQLNYANPATQQAMIDILLKIADQCDGVRCDMAMLVLPDVFEKTWGKPAPAFWGRAIEQVRSKVPYFCFMAEVYWDLEWTLQQLGFDYTYDKRLYDRLEHRQSRAAREHLHADMDYQNKMVRFLENHDEPRAAATFTLDVHQAAAAITYLAPGLRFFHQGQLQGYTRRISPHLCRGPVEPVNLQLQDFYNRLLAILKQPVVREGTWQWLECSPAWEGNWTSDCFISSCWHHSENEWLLITVNYAPNQSQCYVRLPIANLRQNTWILQDILGDATYERDGNMLHSQGLFLDMQPWQASVFSVKTKAVAG